MFQHVVIIFNTRITIFITRVYKYVTHTLKMHENTYLRKSACVFLFTIKDSHGGAFALVQHMSCECDDQALTHRFCNHR